MTMTDINKWKEDNFGKIEQVDHNRFIILGKNQLQQSCINCFQIFSKWKWNGPFCVSKIEFPYNSVSLPFPWGNIYQDIALIILAT